MKSPRLTVMRHRDSPKAERFKEHLKLCEQCRDALTELDLCLEGLDMRLDEQGIKELLEKYGGGRD